MTGSKPARLSRDAAVVARNSFVLLSRQSVLWILGAILVLILPRYLGAEGLGQLQFALSFASMFVVVLSLGMREFIVKEVARQRNRIHHFLGSAILVRFVSSVAVLTLIFAFVELFGPHENPARSVVLIVGLAVVLNQNASLFAHFIHGTERMTPPAVAEIAGKVLVVLFGGVLLVSGAGVTTYAWCLVAGALVHLALNAYFLRRDVEGPRISVSTSTAMELLRGSLPFLLLSVLLGIQVNVDVITLRILTDEQTVGWYAAALNLFEVVFVVPLAFTMAMLPTLARLHVSDTQIVADITHGIVVALNAIVVPTAVALSLGSSFIIDFLPYPDTFSNSIPLLTLLALMLPLTAFLTVLGTLAAAIDRQASWVRALSVGVVLNIVLNVTLIPIFVRSHGNGAIGAALATLLAEIAMMAIATRVLRDVTQEARVRRALVYTLTISVLSLIVGFGCLALTGSPIASALLAVAVFYAASIGAGCLRLRDLQTLIASVVGKQAAE